MSRKYRFYGDLSPKDRHKPPILNTVPSTTVAEGTATMRLYEPIDEFGDFWGTSAAEFATALDALPASTTKIALHINSPGGDVFEGIAILNLLRQHPADVTAYVDGIAASAASFIACGVGTVVMGENAQMMIHDPSGICLGNAKDMRDMASLLDSVGNNIASIYAAKTGTDVGTWRDAMLAETWYSAQEAVDAGLADSAMSTRPATTDSLDTFDLTCFTYAGRDKAPAPGTAPTASEQADLDAGWSRQQQRHRHIEHALDLAS